MGMPLVNMSSTSSKLCGGIKMETPKMIQEEEIVEKLKKFMNTEDQDIFCLTGEKRNFLITVGSYLDCESNRLNFRKGYSAFVEKEDIRYLKSEWENRFGSYLSLTDVPLGLQWLIVMLILCYNAYAKKLKKNKTKVTEKVSDLIKTCKRDGFDPRAFLLQMVELNKNITKRMLFSTNHPYPKRRRIAKFDTAIKQWDNQKKQIGLAPCIRRIEVCRSTDPNCTLSTSDSCDNHSSNSSDFNQQQNSLIRRCDDSDNDGVNYHEQQRDGIQLANELLAALIFDPAKIVVEPIVLKEGWLPKQKLMGSIRPNRYIANAMRDVVISIIDDSVEDANMSVTFGAIIKKLAKNITAAILNRPCFDQSELIWSLTTLKSDEERIALAFVCTNLLPLMNTPLVTVPWKAIVTWCEELSKIINDIITEIDNRRKNELKVSLDDLNIEVGTFRNKLEARIYKMFATMVPLLEKLVKVSDTCLYLLFGLNTFRQNNGGYSFYTDLLAKMVLSSWRSLGKFPVDFSRSKKDLEKIFWSLPLAYMMRLRGFGVVEEQNTVCSIDEFLEEELKKQYTMCSIDEFFEEELKIARDSMAEKINKPDSAQVTTTSQNGKKECLVHLLKLVKKEKL